ncbi:MAG: TonB-dependent receptor [Endomicrobiales bacterium]|nr:TonB-dependent receptor [Endomicrobiales bacterium]
MEKTNRKIALILVTAAFVFTQSIRAEVFLSLSRTALTPTRYEQKIRNLPNSASVVSREDIEASNATQTTDILGELPGIFVKKTGSFGRADVDIRGIGDSGRQIGVFIDGRPDKMGMYGCSVTHTLPMNNIERIEVIRGPESVLYGSEAFGGVINIITKRAKEKFEGEFVTSMGTFNTQNYLLQQGSKLGKFDYYISANKRSTDGHIENSSYDANDYTGQAGYRFSGNSDLSVSAKYFSGIKNEPYPLASGTWNDYKRGSLDATYKQRNGGLVWSLKLYRSFGEHEFSDGFNSKDYTNGVMLHGKYPVLLNNMLSAGIDYRYQFADIMGGVAPVMLGEYSKYEYGVYVDEKHTFFGRLSINAGARLNKDEYSGEIVTPKFGAVYDASENTVLRAVWSQGFRAPQLNDLYLFAGNEDLKPEKVTNTEAGIRQSVNERLYVDIGGFVMNGSDLIEIRNMKKINIGEFEFKGIETACNLIVSEGIDLQANYTYFDPGEKTAGRPKDKAGISLKYSNGIIAGLLSASYVGRYFAGDNSTLQLDDYLILNIKVDYKLLKNMSVFAAVDNITNKKYRIYHSFSGSSGIFTMPQCSADFGVKYAF